MKEAVESMQTFGKRIVSAVDLKKLKASEIICNITKKGCFVAGTLVKTKDGYKRIEEIEEGDIVYSFDELNNEIVLREVKNLITNKVEESIKIQIQNKEIETTSGHLFYVKNKGWIEAKEVSKGDILITLDGKELIENITEEYYFETEVYNLEIEGSHTFFITEDDVLTHNEGECSKKLKKLSIKKEIFPFWKENAKHRETAKKYLLENIFQDGKYSKKEAKAFLDKAWDLAPSPRGIYLEEFVNQYNQFHKGELISIAFLSESFEGIDFIKIKKDVSGEVISSVVSYKTINVGEKSYNTVKKLTSAIKTRATELGNAKVKFSPEQIKKMSQKFPDLKIQNGIIPNASRELIVNIPEKYNNMIKQIDLDDIMESLSDKNINLKSIELNKVIY